jgi:hypothetical protein
MDDPYWLGRRGVDSGRGIHAVIVLGARRMPFATLILHSFLRGVPNELIEAAAIDGASRLRTFVSVILPVARNAIVTAGLFSFLFAWADFLFAVTLTSQDNHAPITVDIPATFEALADSIRAGLNVALSGIQWWNSDIGGFHGGDPEDETFRELIVRWFQFGAFCPIMRLHGHREPRWSHGPVGNGGGPNEVWSFGQPVEDQYMFGPDILVAPVTEFGARQRRVYLPAGADWTHTDSGRRYPGGGHVTVDAPLESIPLFVRDDAATPLSPRQ